MKKSMKKLIFTILIVLMIGGILEVKAAPATITASSPLSSITITRKVQSSKTFDNTFTYTVTPASTNPTGETGIPTGTTVVFDSDPVEEGVVTAAGNLSFVGSSFTQVGDYSYTVTETASTNDATFPISTNSFVVYVSVRYDNSGNMVATLVSQATNTEDNTKGDIVFTGDPAVYSSITIGKTVTGNMADRNKVFSFLVNINGNAGDTYTINYSNGTTGTYTVGNPNQYVNLKHGETVIIGDGSIPLGTKFTIIEQDATDYDTSMNVCITKNDCDDNTLTAKTTGELTLNVAKTDDETPGVVFTNSKSESTLTGVILSIFPYILIVSVVIAATLFYMFTQKKKNNA